jgi:SRSO17 transposase
MPTDKDWRRDLDAFLRPFLAALGHKARRKWAPLYVEGLFADLERKSLRPLADRVAPGDHEQLHHFVCTSTWDTSPLEEVLARQAQRMVGGRGAVLIVDDTGLPKSGSCSVGVGHQYCGVLGKMANCQTLVSLTLARGETPVPVALRLFLPREWTDAPERCEKCGVPPDRLEHRTKNEIALEEIDRVRASGVKFDVVLADAGYGQGMEFRRALSERGLRWAVGVPRHQKVYSTGVEVLYARPRPRGRPKELPRTTERARPVEEVLDALPPRRWRRIAWRRGSKRPLVAEFAMLRVRAADGPIHERGWHLPGEEVWLVGERRATGERKYYLSNLAIGTRFKRLVAVIKKRWACEQGHQVLKGELGLDHFEGRSWLGLHHHALLAMVAFAFLQHLRLREATRWPGAGESPGPPQRPTLPEVRRALVERLEVALGARCSRCGKKICRRKQPL